MRRGTVVMLVILFAMIIVAGVVQVVIASQDRPACPGPTANPNALPADGSQTCQGVPE